MKTYTKKEKNKYFSDLRSQWAQVKNSLTACEIDEIKAAIMSHGMNISPWSYAFTLHSMRARGLDGIPYLDCKTFNGWKSAGFKVKKGEHSAIKGITWIGYGNKSEDPDEASSSNSGGVFPKEYHLFHRTQVEALAA